MPEKTTGNATNAIQATASLSKIEAVRKAMAKLGRDAGRADILKYVKATFGMDMTVDHVSTCKSEILRHAKKKAAKTKPSAKTAVVAAPTAPASAVGAPKTVAGQSKSGIQMHDVLTVKALVKRVGAGQLKTLVDAFVE
jgi:hypothetical protein